LTASVLAAVAYLLLPICQVLAFLLCLEWVLHAVPGAGLNPVRRGLFLSLFPLLSLSERFFSIEIGKFRSRGLLLALSLSIIGRYGVPWLVLASYGLRG
jgi:hypothetical protein